MVGFGEPESMQMPGWGTEVDHRCSTSLALGGSAAGFLETVGWAEGVSLAFMLFATGCGLVVCKALQPQPSYEQVYHVAFRQQACPVQCPGSLLRALPTPTWLSSGWMPTYGTIHPKALTRAGWGG